jgi:L-alanine-DL-glutamate epimerase-like enolase superfamily enzyme
MALRVEKKVGKMYKQIDERIKKVEGFALSSPYGKGESLGQPLGVKSVGLVKIYTESGAYGLGETYSGVYAPELIQPIVVFLESYLIGRLIGDDLIFDDIKNIPFIGGNGILQSVFSAIEIAIWDVRGKILELPTSQLINNNSRKSIPLYASSGTVIFTPDDITKDVENILNLGYTAYKMRVGYQDWNTDIKRVENARNALGNNDLMVDAIMGTLRPAWNSEKAISRAKNLVDFNLRWLEEPVHPENIKGLAEVCHSKLVPIAAGEAYSGNGEYQAMLDLQAVDVLQFDATHSGGILACIELARKSEIMKLDSALHVWGSAVAIAANAQVAFAASSIDILEIPMVSLELTEKMWIEPPIIKNGVWHSNDLPGLGVTLDDSLIRKYKLQPNSGYRLP